jgi:hypothetical protein
LRTSFGDHSLDVGVIGVSRRIALRGGHRGLGITLGIDVGQSGWLLVRQVGLVEPPDLQQPEFRLCEEIVVVGFGGRAGGALLERRGEVGQRGDVVVAERRDDSRVGVIVLRALGERVVELLVGRRKTRRIGECGRCARERQPQERDAEGEAHVDAPKRACCFGSCMRESVNQLTKR